MSVFDLSELYEIHGAGSGDQSCDGHRDDSVDAVAGGRSGLTRQIGDSVGRCACPGGLVLFVHVDAVDLERGLCDETFDLGGSGGRTGGVVYPRRLVGFDLVRRRYVVRNGDRQRIVRGGYGIPPITSPFLSKFAYWSIIISLPQLLHLNSHTS